MNISEHITYGEAIFSQTAARHRMENVPDEDTLKAMRMVAEKCFEPVRRWYGKSIQIGSFYRNPKLNLLVSGKSNSQHIRGEAIDMTTYDVNENKKIFDWIESNLEYDQLINEYNYKWVHVSFTTRYKNRMQIINI